ncbi:AAA family ATPase [Actinomycetospora sp. TBRC 11914]|uniref:ATP-binding protein n=1 Tax=Actinomycetospora sp. TBRC 11914 TaxID=2729387 RepID=UPI00145D25BA|nr:AAA family ATPase [Actinomycetospora sp. TBRC 11914]NMO90426.1 AAA family ATPase [Actinomycetospora sp. TBRC 11914]
MTEIRLLGTVEVVGADPVRSELLRTLLALLALDPGRPVPTPTLIDEIYGEALPQDPRAALQIQITRLRKVVAPARVESIGGGYALGVPRAAVDLCRFHDAEPLVALANIDGEPFPGCRSTPRLETERRRVEVRWLELVEARARALLDDDQPGAALSVAAPALAGHLDREHLAALVATALHRVGRSGEALRTIAATRRELKVEHGLDPGPELRGVELSVLEARERTLGPVVVGREGPLATIREGLDDPEAGRLVLVAGEAGIGKSTLLGAAAEEASRRGARVGRGLWEHDQAPFAAWVEALHRVGVEPPSLRDPAPGRTLRRRLAVAADEGHVLVTLDDAHRADRASLDVLRALGRAGLPPGVVVLVAAREPDAVAHPAWGEAAADLAPLEGVERTVLRELDEAGTRALVGAELGETLADALWARTGGHPLHLSALLAEVRGLPDDEARVAATARVPERLRPLLAHQLEQLPEACRAGLEALAVLGPLPLAELADAVGEPARRLAGDLRPAVSHTLVEPTADGFAFRHELTAAAVLDTVPAVVAAQLHLARHEALPADAAPFTVLRHAVGAAALLPPATVADAHLPAVLAAYRDGALADAERLLDTGLEHATRPWRVRLLRGLVLEARGRVDEAAEEFDAVVADPTADVADAVAAAMGDDAQGPSVAGRPRRLERLRRVRDLDLDDRQRARVLRGMITEEQQLVGVTETPSLVAELMALGDSRAEADPHLAAEVAVATAFLQLDAAVPAAERVGTCLRARELAEAAGELTLRFEADELLVAALVTAGRLDDALARHADLAPEAERRHRPRTMWATRLVDAALLLGMGKVSDSDEAAQDALARGQELGIPDALGAFFCHLVARHLLTGDMTVLGGLPATAAGMYPRVSAWRACAAVDAVHGGDAATARTRLTEFHEQRAGREGGLFDRTGLCLAACAAYAVGDAVTARLVLDALPEDPESTVVVGIGAAFFGPLDLYRGLATAALGDGAARDAVTLFRAAGSTAARLGWTPWADAAESLAHRHDGVGTVPASPPATPAPNPPLGLRPVR